MKADKGKQLAHYLWRILVITLINFMIVLMLWNSGGKAAALSKYGSRGGEVTPTALWAKTPWPLWGFPPAAAQAALTGDSVKAKCNFWPLSFRRNPGESPMRDKLPWERSL